MNDITLTYYETDRGIECGYQHEGAASIHLISHILDIAFPSEINIGEVAYKRICRVIRGDNTPSNWDSQRMDNIFIPKHLIGRPSEEWKAWNE